MCQINPLENCDSIGGLDLYAFPSEGCPGQNNAIINLYPSAGTPPYTYLWSNGETTEDLENLGPGLYSVTVTDSNGVCDTVSREVTEYGIISLYYSVHFFCSELGSILFPEPSFNQMGRK